jgi:acyl dehydratase
MCGKEEGTAFDERTISRRLLRRTFSAGRLRVTREQIKAFAAQFDPQPFHFEESAAKSSIFQGLATSGWHTAALTMQLQVEPRLIPQSEFSTDFREGSAVRRKPPIAYSNSLRWSPSGFGIFMAP